MARSGHWHFSQPALEKRPSAHPPQPIPPISSSAPIGTLVKHLDLTHRQAEVLHWVAEGKSNEEISIILECSFFTVKNHLREIYRRLDVHGRVAAAASAYHAHIAEANSSQMAKDHQVPAGPAARRKPARAVTNGRIRRAAS